MRLSLFNFDLHSTSTQLGYQLLAFLFIGEVVGDNIVRVKPSLSYEASFTYSVLDDYPFWKKWMRLEIVCDSPLMLWFA